MEDFDEKQDECKLEYTTIHKDYMNILDEHIDAQLKDKFNEEQIDLFKTTYAQNETTYREKNPVIHETLYAFVDFEQFKSRIVSYKMAYYQKKIDDELERLANRSFIVKLEDHHIGYFDTLNSEDFRDTKLGWQRVQDTKVDHNGFSG